MKKYKLIIPVILFTSLTLATLPSYAAESNSNPRSLPQLDQENLDRAGKDGNYKKIEDGMNPVVIKGIRSKDTSGEFSKVGGGSIYIAPSTDTTPITYSAGASVMLTPKPYLIWYGSWNTGTKSLAPTTNDYYNFTNKLLTDLSSSSRWSNIMKAYYSRSSGLNSKKSYVGNLQTPVNVFVPANQQLYGTTLTQSSIYKIVKNTFPTTDPNGIYTVITSTDVLVSGFNAGTPQFCGYHSYSSTLKYAFVGDSANNPGCQGQSSPTPNLNVGADSFASTLIHEIEEATTDPQLNAWWSSTSTGNENADKCAWTWGQLTQDTTSLAFYNYSWNTSKYLIQQEFKLSTTPSKVTSSKDTYNGVCSQA